MGFAPKDKNYILITTKFGIIIKTSMVFNRFIYESDANDGNGGGSAPEAIQLTVDELKGYGFDSRESLTQFLAQQKEANKPDAEKQKAIEIERANFLQYTTENELLKLEEYNQYESLKVKADRDLVYEKFVNEFKEDNPELSAEELAEEAKTAFENEYKLTASNEKTKARGEARLAKEAAELKNPYETKYKTAKESFDLYKKAQTTFPEFVKFIEEVVAENTPEKLVVKVKDGTEEIDIEQPLTKEQKEEVAKLFRNPKNYNKFVSGDKDLKAALAKKINGYHKENNFDKVVENSYRKGFDNGKATGSTVGAHNFFGAQQARGQESGKVVTMTLEESNAKIAEARQRAKGRR